jgi:hypothetical protein
LGVQGVQIRRDFFNVRLINQASLIKNAVAAANTNAAMPS